MLLLLAYLREQQSCRYSLTAISSHVIAVRSVHLCSWNRCRTLTRTSQLQVQLNGNSCAWKKGASSVIVLQSRQHFTLIPLLLLKVDILDDEYREPN